MSHTVVITITDGDVCGNFLNGKCVENTLKKGKNKAHKQLVEDVRRLYSEIACTGETQIQTIALGAQKVPETLCNDLNLSYKQVLHAPDL